MRRPTLRDLRNRYDEFNALPLERRSLLIGLAALLVAGIYWLCSSFGWTHAAVFFRSYLVGWMLCLGIAMGAMVILMMQHLTGGSWGILVRRPAEAASLTLPLLTVLFIPVVLGMPWLYPWADRQELSSDPVVQHRHSFFNIPAVGFRMLLFLVLWSGLAYMLRRLSLPRDEADRPRNSAELRTWSAFGLVFYFLSMTSCGIDLIMSRDPHWYSSVFGMVLVIGQSLAGLVFLVIVLWMLHERPPMHEAIRPQQLNDIGNLMLMFVILWAYTSFAQLLVNWMGNQQTEVHFFYQRVQAGWKWVSVALIALHFFVPFFLLLGQENKRRLGMLTLLAVWLLAMRWIDVVYLIEPTSRADQPNGASWLDLVTPIGLGGVCFAYFLWHLSKAPLLPVGERDLLPREDHGDAGRIATA